MNVPSSWLVIGGAFIGFTLTLLLMIPLMIWAGFPRRRERELERDLCDAWQYIDELRKLEKQSAENTRREGREDE